MSAAYGFAVPEAFAALVGAIHGWATARAAVVPGGRRKKADALESLFDLDDLLGWFPAGAVLGPLVSGKTARHDAGYDSTPPEFMRFGDMGVDGAQFGYIVHAPELNSAEYPIGHFCPMDFSDGVSLIGADTRDAVRRMLASEWRQSVGFSEDNGTDKPDPGRVRELAAAIGVEWSPESDLDELWEPRVRPTVVPDGWTWVATSDGVGVLAAAGAFRPGVSHSSADLRRSAPGFRPRETDDHISAAERDLADGFPASALYRLRELWWDRASEGPVMGTGSRLMAGAYERLGRPLLARITLHRATQDNEMP